MPIDVLHSISAEHSVDDSMAALKELRAKMPTLSPDDARALHEEVLAKQAELAINGDESVLQELRSIEQQLDSMNTSTMETVTDYVNDGIESLTPIATKAVETAKETAGNAADMVREEVQGTLLNPAIPTSSKVLRYAGMGVIGYGVYRLAKWFLGKDPSVKPPTTFLGKVGSWLWGGAKLVGVAALAGMAVNRFAPKNSQTPDTPKE